MKHYYKFLNKGDVHYYFEDETIVISSSKYFSELEDKWIGDKMEGRSSVNIDHEVITSDDKDFIKKVADIGIRIDYTDAHIQYMRNNPELFPRHTVVINNDRSTYESYFFMWCCAFWRIQSFVV
jgi:hypothetical protein